MRLGVGDVAAWAQIISVVITLLVVPVAVLMWRTYRHMAALSARDADHDRMLRAQALDAAEAKDAIRAVQAELARQFGGNSNGIRQAIDGVRDDIGETKESVARLEGRFDEHVQQHGQPMIRRAR